MAISYTKIWNGVTVVPKVASASDLMGELEVLSSTGKLYYHNGVSISGVLTESHSATVINKAIDADNNTISNLETDNLKAGVLNTSTSLAGATDQQIPSALATKTYVDNSAAGVQNDVDDLITLSGVPANSTDLGTFTGVTIPDGSDNKEAFQALETNLEMVGADLYAHILDATDAHDASAISNIPSGNLSATDQQSANNELQSDIDTRATTTALNAHINNTTGAHAATAISNTPAGTIGSITVQAALNELDGDIQGHITNGTGAHTASAITNVPSGNLAAINVQTALNELQTDIDTRTAGPGSATDNHVVRFDGTTGKLVQDGSPVVISDAGAISGLTGITSSGTAGLATVTASGSVTITGALDANGVVQYASANDAATGANATLTAPTTKVIRLTSGTLTSIDAVPAGSDAQEIILENVTGASIVINNDTGGTAANRILTGTGSSLTLANTASVSLSYDTTTTRWRVIGGSGSGSTSSGINYILNPNAEAGTSGWAVYADAAGVIPVDGTGGAPNVTIARNTTTPLRGTADFLFTKDAANRQGQGTSYDFTIDLADEASIQVISMDYTVSANYADTVSGNLINSDMQVFVYDVTNATLIYCDTQNIAATSTKGHLVTTFQTASNSVSYRLIFHVASTNATAYTVNFDNVSIGPKNLIKGAVATDWQSYTPTFVGFGTVSPSQLYYKRIGDTVSIRGRFTPGTSTGVTASFTLPSGLSIPTTGVNGTEIMGHWWRDVATATTRKTSPLNFGSSTGTTINFGSDDYTTAAGPGTALVGTSVSPASINIYIDVVGLPIAGWSSNLQLSEDSGNRLIAMSASGNAGTVISADTTNIPFTTVAYDYTSSYSSPTYTVPETGVYDIVGSMAFVASSARVTRLVVNGSSVKSSGLDASGTIHGFSFEHALTKGQTINIWSSGSGTLTNSSTNHWISISKRSSPQTLAGSEAVAVRAIQTSGQSITNSGTGVDLVWDSAKTYDTHNAFVASTGIFTAPVSGRYRVGGKYRYNSAAWTLSNEADLLLVKNGSTVSLIGVTFIQATNTMEVTTSGSDTILLTKGDTIKLQAANNRTGGSSTIGSGATLNYITIDLLK